MQAELKGSWRSRWLSRLEALLLLCLALHGATILISGGRPGDWLVVGLVIALAGWAFLQPASGSGLVAVRAAGALIAAWALAAVSGGPGSLFTLWFFPLTVVYSLLLPLRFSIALPFASTLLYISLGAIPDSPLPWAVILSQALLIALVSGTGLYFRRRRDEQVALRNAGVDERARQLQTERLAALDRLARGMAHDFNNLFTVIAGQIAMARGGVEWNDPARAHLETAGIAVEQAISLSRRLQISSARSAWAMAPVALNSLIEFHIHVWRETTPANISLQTRLSADVPAIRGDPDAITILLQEVIAHRAAAFGGNEGTLTITTRRHQLPDDDAGFGRYIGYTLNAGDYVALAIEDDAEAIHDEQLTTLFEPYGEDSSGAHGLALAVVLGIVRSHQGGVAATSASHRGNTFTFLFPTFQEDNETVSAPVTARAQDRQSTWRLIMLVSADLSLRDSLESALGDPALRVMVADDNTRALALHAEFAKGVELVVVSAGSAAETDIELIPELLRRNAHLPIIVIGGRVANHASMRNLIYLPPPIELPKLTAAVRAVLSHDRAPDISS